MKRLFLLIIFILIGEGLISLFILTNPTNYFLFENINALAAVQEAKSCYSGGAGSSACSIEAGIEIMGVGVSAGCSIQCKDGYYSCCSIRCTCEIERQSGNDGPIELIP